MVLMSLELIKHRSHSCIINYMDDNYLKLCVSGRDYKIRVSKLLTRLQRQQSEFISNRGFTRLELLALGSCIQERKALVDDYFSDTDTYSLDRSPLLFEHILYFHRTGHLHAPNDICPSMFLQELDFWKINKEDTSDCCCAKLGIEKRGTPDEPRSASFLTINENDQVTVALKNFNENNKRNANDAHVERGTGDEEAGEEDNLINHHEKQFKGVFFGKLRLTLWKFFEDPTSSYAAKVFTVLSIGFVLTSVLCLIIASLPDLQEWNALSGQFEPVFVLRVIEYVCIFWFSMDFVVRFLIAVNRLSFLKESMNIVDMLSIFPFYIEFLFELTHLKMSNIDNIKGALLVMRILRVLRVMRLFRLARYSGGLKSIGTTISSSKKELSMLLMFISTTIILFSTMVYFFEKDVENTKFTSIPATFWWCIVTMTTVGYGDLVPKTLLGKIVASVTSVSGVIVLAFPITMIVENFNKCYRKEDVLTSPKSPSSSTVRPKVHRFGLL